jgi:hypothetical protein
MTSARVLFPLARPTTIVPLGHRDELSGARDDFGFTPEVDKIHVSRSKYKQVPTKEVEDTFTWRTLGGFAFTLV